MYDVTMPRLSESMEEGAISRWLKASGDYVRRGEDIVEIETDKATVMHEAEVSGTLEILAEVDEVLPIGHVIARIDENGGPA